HHSFLPRRRLLAERQAIAMGRVLFRRLVAGVAVFVRVFFHPVRLRSSSGLQAECFSIPGDVLEVHTSDVCQSRWSEGTGRFPRFYRCPTYRMDALGLGDEW